MQYIILDMEWNQPWPGSYSAQKRLPFAIRGEIIQIGAVRLLEDQRVADEFQVLIRPKYYKKLNHKVSSLTGLKDAALKADGVSFPEAVARFRAWCGEDCTFLAWGFDDFTILKENLTLYGLDSDWISRWYNAQMIFNAQTDGSTSQKALKTALELMSIEPSRPAHDALGDAYHTALICSRLRLPEGIAAYEQAVRNHENGFHGAELNGCVKRQVYHGYRDKTEAVAAMSARENLCPVCGGAMQCGRWIAQPGQRLMAMSACPEHGSFLIRIRLAHDPDGMLRVNRLVYAPDSDAAQTYAAQAQKPRRRRRRRVSAKPKSTE